MRAEELQIGDIVQIAEPNKYAGSFAVIKSLQAHKENEGAYFNVFFHGEKGCGETDVFNEDLRPIPLTENVLLKSGFEQNSKRILFDEFRMLLNEGTEQERWIFVVLSKRRNYVKVLYSSYNGHENGVDCFVKNDCMVHHLQHLFRLLDIEVKLNVL